MVTTRPSRIIEGKDWNYEVHYEELGLVIESKPDEAITIPLTEDVVGILEALLAFAKEHAPGGES